MASNSNNINNNTVSLAESSCIFGHVFVVYGDLNTFACDARLIPSGLNRKLGHTVIQNWLSIDFSLLTPYQIEVLTNTKAPLSFEKGLNKCYKLILPPPIPDNNTPLPVTSPSPSSSSSFSQKTIIKPTFSNKKTIVAIPPTTDNNENIVSPITNTNLSTPLDNDNTTQENINNLLLSSQNPPNSLQSNTPTSTSTTTTNNTNPSVEPPTELKDHLVVIADVQGDLSNATSFTSKTTQPSTPVEEKSEKDDLKTDSAATITNNENLKTEKEKQENSTITLLKSSKHETQQTIEKEDTPQTTLKDISPKPPNQNESHLSLNEAPTKLSSIKKEIVEEKQENPLFHVSQPTTPKIETQQAIEKENKDTTQNNVIAQNSIPQSSKQKEETFSNQSKTTPKIEIFVQSTITTSNITTTQLTSELQDLSNFVSNTPTPTQNSTSQHLTLSSPQNVSLANSTVSLPNTQAQLTSPNSTQNSSNISNTNTSTSPNSTPKTYTPIWPNIRPQPYITCITPYFTVRQPNLYIEPVRDFLETVATDLEKETPPKRAGRERYLIALPVLGTGGGGANFMSGKILSILLKELYVFAEKYKIDVALVTNDRAMYAAAINLRNNMLANNDNLSYVFACLNPNIKAIAEKLAKLLISGNLVLFLGAGVSRSVGLPIWSSLLSTLAQKVGLTQEEISMLDKMNFLDKASVIQSRFNNIKETEKEEEPQIQTQDESLSRVYRLNTPVKSTSQATRLQIEVAKTLRTTLCGLPHAQLASTPAKEIITTNYDSCFELASEQIGHSLNVLPYHSSNTDSQRWILKLHGCVTHPEDIVLTREDYLRYRDRREALAGIVQALLITKHLLFVGFSCTDENFYQIMSVVKKSIPEDNRKNFSFGTVINVEENKLLDDIWKPSLDIFTLVDHNLPEKYNAIPASARRQEIFLDYLISKSITNTSHILEDRFDSVLKDGEREFRDSLKDFIRRQTPAATQTEVYQRFLKFVSEIGGQHTSDLTK